MGAKTILFGRAVKECFSVLLYVPMSVYGIRAYPLLTGLLYPQSRASIKKLYLLRKSKLCFSVFFFYIKFKKIINNSAKRGKEGRGGKTEKCRV